MLLPYVPICHLSKWLPTIRSRGCCFNLVLLASYCLMNQPVEHPVQDLGLELFQSWIKVFGLVNFFERFPSSIDTLQQQWFT